MTRLSGRMLLPLTGIVCLLWGCQDSDRPAGTTAATRPAAAADQPAERPGVVTMRGKPVTLLGDPPEVGDRAPAFTAVANDMSPYQFNPTGDNKVYILSAVPSVDTPTCSKQTQRFNQEAAGLGPDVQIVTVSMDLPFAQKRWCGAEGVQNLQTVSDFRDRAFGRAYGVQIKESGLLARSVWVVGKDGTIKYAQIVPELSKEPDYAPVLAAAREAVK